MNGPMYDPSCGSGGLLPIVTVREEFKRLWCAVLDGVFDLDESIVPEELPSVNSSDVVTAALLHVDPPTLNDPDLRPVLRKMAMHALTYFRSIP